jgi:hypothetical protein
MIKRDDEPVHTKSRWQTEAELSLHGVLGCEYEAAEKVAEILVSVHIPDRVLVEAKQAVTMVMEKEMSNIEADQHQRTFTILVQTQLSQPLETPTNEIDSRELHSRSRCWGFFITEKRTSETNAEDHVVISIHLYHEGRSV